MTSPKLFAYIVIVVPFVVLQIVTLGKKVRKLSRDSQDKIADISSQGTETLTSVKLVQAYNQEAFEFGRFSQFVEQAYQTALERVRMRARLTAVVIVLAFGAVGLVLWIGGKDVLLGRLTAGELSSFVFYSVLVAGAIGAISEVMGDIQRAAGAAERLIELMQAESEIKAPEHPIALSAPVKGHIQFSKVTFYYPTRLETAAVKEVHFEMLPGETVALVGPSGAGKSTILQLLLRFYDPQTGVITVDGIPLNQLDPKDWRQHCALVPQEPIVFSETVYDNIRFGNLHASDAQVMDAAKAAMAWDFIQKLPQQFQTYVGERGVRLSGGERQRIALARAIVREPKILLLDEATNALDAENEQLVQLALEKIMQRCTTLVIAHRLATVLKSNKIIVMNAGQIEAIGTHRELLAQNPLYARLAELQFNI